MELPVDRFVTDHELKTAAERLGSIEELLVKAKEVLQVSVWNANYPLAAFSATFFIDEASRRAEKITDDEKRRSYEKKIEEIVALRDKNIDEAMGGTGKSVE